MKTTNIIVVCLALTFMRAHAQVASTPTGGNPQPPPAPTPCQVVDIGPNHQVWQWETYEPKPNGQFAAHIHSYTELASGLDYLDTKGQWVASQEQIEAFAGGAIARQGQHQVIFANNLNSAGSVDLQTPDGKRLRSNILGLMYYDSTTGNAVQIAQVQNSEGELISANQVLYPNAFVGIKADVLYTYRLDGMEQDVILREQLPVPETLGMNSATTELEVFTEFIDPPVASVAAVESNEPGLDPDQTVSWGATSLGRGKAFNLGGEDSPATVVKRYVNIQGQYYLQEKVKYQDIQAALAKLPEQASNERRLPMMASKNLVLPKAPTVKTAARPIRLAAATPSNQGYVLDYVTVNAAYTNYTFQSDTTYYVSSALNLYGTNTFEGGAVIKYATNGSIQIVPGPTGMPGVNWKGGAYHPVVFTAKDDSTVGESVGTGSPTGYYGSPMLYLVDVVSSAPFTGLRMAYAKTGILFSGGTGTAQFYSAQFVNCQNGIVLGDENVLVGNALFAGTSTNFLFQGGSTVNAQNVTFSGSGVLATAPAVQTECNLALTNCILANVTNLLSGVFYSASGNYNGFYNTPYLASLAPVHSTNTFYPFQQVGAGSFYLTNGCAFTNAGTAVVDPNDLSLLLIRTTHPPLVYSNLTISVATTFSPQVQRDTNSSPDLGYHYDPLDYVFGGVNVYSNLTFTAGTAVGWFELPGSGGPGYGITIYDKVVLALNGTASQPCTMARYDTVQEGGTGLWKDKGYLAAIVAQSLSGGYSMNPTNAPMAKPNFTRHFVLAGDPSHYREYNALSRVIGQNSEFYCGAIGAYSDDLSCTNCLFDRTGMGVGGSNPARWWLRNCTVRGGSLTLSEYGQV